MTAQPPPFLSDYPARPSVGLFSPVQSDTADLVDAGGNECLARDIKFLADGTASLMFLDGSSYDLTVTENSRLSDILDPMYVRRVLASNTTLENSEMICIK